MRDQEIELLRTYLKNKESTPKLRAVLQPHFLLNAILFIPFLLTGIIIYYFGVPEVAFMVLGIWLGLFLCDIRHGKIFIRLWPKVKKYIDWEKIERKINEDKNP